MKIAVEGCCHGELDKIYETITYLEKKEAVKVNLLLCCGDFQAVRNEGDLKCMAVPAKYRTMQTFYKYYSGEKKAPVLTIFIGGNHEASNHLQELSYGGWVAPNIYYLGYAGVVRYKGIRIGGLSGIFKSHDYRKGHHEFPPYSPETLRSVYHVRNIEVFKLKQIRMPVDIFLSHDWPRGIYHHGPTEDLLRKKKFLRHEVESNALGSPAAAELLEHLQPSYWFSAHLHVKFAALKQHPPKPKAAPRATKFLSLDKCLPYREFLQIVDVPERAGSSDNLEYDPEWLAILKTTNDLQRTTPHPWNPPENNGLHQRWDFTVSEEALMKVVEQLSGELAIPENFSRTVPPYNPSSPQYHAAPSYHANPQTTELCATLGLTDLYTQVGQASNMSGVQDGPGEEEDTQSGDEPSQYTTDISATSNSFNPDEITIEDEWEEEDIEEEPKSSADPKLPRGDIHTPCHLVLPPPKLEASPIAMSPLLDLPPPCQSTPAVPNLSPSDLEERFLKRTSDEAGDTGSRTTTPRIKRRNQIIYATVDDDCDE
ncbi:lariat debranching enzyme [Syngnathoides biaculeatus]|uniref:lariat debranching enzyme n=1 Tax=Syngnathoides biaculeatus TaxID=300417 RepID=UPI002ADE7B06|nr:lariat debranching enzyme [Syngnathoides biaculeatus]XP_061698640.1 lariat debranching enzyme [Syngnathoides biaculeatus]XP_061698641.1 lariat debranching enzyme [Syngnathoides biaculeatus]XP_061698642.1 lariat debranching enzyme [Syngnathoides biaculeatus]